MFERFTDRARKVMALAHQEAQRFNHDHIGTEHILLGLIKEGSGVGANVLKTLGIELQEVRVEVERLTRSGRDMVAADKLPQTPGAAKVIEYAILEAREFNHPFIGTEHILLGLLRVQDDVSSRVLTNLGLKLDQIRAEVCNLLGRGVDEAEPTPPLDECDDFIHKAIQHLALAWDRAFCKRDRVLADEIRAHIERLHAVLTKRQSPPGGPESKNHPGNP